jgi:alkaline phosphatase
MKKTMTAALVFATALACMGTAPQRAAAGHCSAKNIIFMVPDGMGIADVTAARILKNGPDGPSLSLELPRVGLQRTYDKGSIITDSASAASAWACGEKFMSGEICFHADIEGGGYKQTILEIAKKKKKATGLVATSTITHATPAVWASHVKSRSCENEIARQYIQLTRPDVMLGGGKAKFDGTSAADKCGTTGDFIAEAQTAGYTVAYTKAEMDAAVADGAQRLLGLFTASGMTPEYLRPTETTEPRLPEMTRAALDILEQDHDGFFLMVEGSQIDWADHENNQTYMLGEMLAFDEAVQVVKDWVDAKPCRKTNTLIVVAPDHETGGYAINGPFGMLPAGGEVEGAFTSPDHTGTDVPIYSLGPGSEELAKPLNNTDVYYVLKAVMK